VLLDVFQEEEVDDEDISDTENTALPACELLLQSLSFLYYYRIYIAHKFKRARVRGAEKYQIYHVNILVICTSGSGVTKQIQCGYVFI